MFFKNYLDEHKKLIESSIDSYLAELTYPEVIAIYLDGKPKPWVGPQDIALAIIGAVFKRG